jgi:molybdopterin-guanine dinucleotide biosynthesis protein B
MRVFGLAGWSGSGKTTLLTRLIPELIRRGISVSTVKHAHHAFDIDKPGKDSWLHREAGAREVMVASARRFALMHELRDAPEPSLDDLVARMAPVDLLLVEGFKAHAHPKLEIHRRRSASRCSIPTTRISSRLPAMWRWRRRYPCCRLTLPQRLPISY